VDSKREPERGIHAALVSANLKIVMPLTANNEAA
jgi:hypothetical protein